MSAVKHIGSVSVVFSLSLFMLFCPSYAQSEKEEEKLAKRIDELIQVFANPQAGTLNIKGTLSAVNELSAIGKPAVPKLVEAILDDNQRIATFSTAALGGIGMPAVKGVRARWPTLAEEQKWRFMGFLGRYDYQASLDFALASLQSKNEIVRQRAIKYAGDCTEPKARPFLLKMLNTEVPERHRWLIIDALTKIPNDDVAEALIVLLAADSWVAKGVGWVSWGLPPDWWPDARYELIPVLDKIDAKKAAPKLLELLSEKGLGKGYFGNRIMPFFAKWGYTESIPEIKRILGSSTNFKRWLAAQYLFQLDDRTGLPMLLAHIESKEADHRRKACKTLADHGDKRDVLTLGYCLDDPDEEVQLLARGGLERITGIRIRAPGQTIASRADLPYWKQWFQQNKGSYNQENREIRRRD
ncbi:MAG: HEAT repeat domain-containing protein [Gemmataceae bacterium]|nr:HEAT repeat domain-containing protein [Gemmataceae bacterium]